MNVDAVIHRLQAAGISAIDIYRRTTESGIDIGIDTGKSMVIGSVPLDDKDDEIFADFLIKEYRKKKETSNEGATLKRG